VTQSVKMRNHYQPSIPEMEFLRKHS